jgi:hypothetical protein
MNASSRGISVPPEKHVLTKIANKAKAKAKS